MKLEELARTSADAARASVRTLEPPEIGRHSRPGWAVPVMAGAAVTALVVGGLVLIDRSQDDLGPADQPVATLPADVAVPRLGLTDDSWRATFATDGSDQPEFETQRFDYYGDASADRPFADDDLLVAWGEDVDSEELSGDATTVRGVSGVLASGDSVGMGPEVMTLSWQDPSGLWVILASRHADGDRLVAIADGLLIDTATGTVAPDPDLGLVRVGTDTGTPFMAPRGSVEAALVAYESVEDTDVSALLTSRRGELAQVVRSAEWWLGAPAEATLADGRGYEFDLAQLFGGDGQTGRLLFWEPARGSTAQLIVSGPASDLDVDLAALADSVVELDDGAWSALLEAQQTPNAEQMDVLYGEGDGEVDGVPYAWALGEIDDQRCFSMSTGNGFGSSCQAPGDAPAAPTAPTILDQGTSQELAYAVVRIDPADPTGGAVPDDVVETTGTFVVERVDAAGATWFVAVGPGEITPVFEVWSGGEVVATLEAGAAVEEAVEEVPAGPDPVLADNPSAVELGVENMDVVFRGGDDRLDLWLGTQGDDVCLVTDGAATSAGCQVASDIMVFPTDDTPNVDTVVVVLRDLPECVVATGLSGPEVGSQAATGSAGHTYDVAWGAEPVTNWALTVTTDAGAGRALDLPDGLTEGSAAFPPDLCA